MENNKVIWPGWEVVRKIGSGSFGAVYEIRRDMFGDVEKAALKVIHIPQNRDEIQELRSLGYDDASITTHFKGHMAYINILRRMSVDCDCAGTSAAEPTAPDIGILASTDLLAVDQASVDMVYALPEQQRRDLVERIESRSGLRQLEYMETMGMGHARYDLVSLS